MFQAEASTTKLQHDEAGENTYSLMPEKATRPARPPRRARRSERVLDIALTSEQALGPDTQHQQQQAEGHRRRQEAPSIISTMDSVTPEDQPAASVPLMLPGRRARLRRTWPM